MDMITVTAKTVDEAVTKALIELETTSDKAGVRGSGKGKRRISWNRRKAGGDPGKEEGDHSG